MSHARNWREIFQPEGEKQQHVFLFNAKLRWARAQLPESELKTYLKSAGFWLIYSNKWTSSSTKISISSRRHSTALVFELALVWDKCFSSSGYPVRFLTSSGTKFPLVGFPTTQFHGGLRKLTVLGPRLMACSSVEERMPCNQRVVGSKAAKCWGFFSSHSVSKSSMS